MNAWWTPSNRRLIRRYLDTFRPYGGSNRGLVVKAGIALAVVTALTLPLPWFTMRAIDVMVASKQPRMVWMLLALWGSILAIKTALSFYQSYCTDRFKQRVATTGKLKLFRHIESAPTRFFQERQIGYLVCRVRDDIDNLVPLWADSVLQVIKSLVFIVAALVLVFMISWKMAALALLTLPLYLLNYFAFGDRVRRLTAETRENFGNMEGKMHDSISAIATVKVFGRELHEAKELAHLMAAAVRSGFALEQVNRLSGSLGSFTQALAPLFVLCYAGFAILRGDMTIGQLVAFVTYVGFLFEPVAQLMRKNLDMQKALASLERVFEILDVQPESNRAPLRIAPRVRAHGELEFQDVSFAYGEKGLALSGINAVIRAGSRVGLVGPSGAGKTTFVNLIPRLLEPTQGRVLLDGVDLRDIPLIQLRSQIGVVAQDTFLFSKSVRENIRFGRLDASDAAVEEAARRAYAHEFIQRLPESYDTQVGNRGTKLSGGERARIAIARALLKDPAILILDEATAFLDSRSEALFQEAVEELMRNRTAIVIAHRLSTITLVDEILVMESGRIRERGHHDELLAAGGLYRVLYDQQLLRPVRGESVTDLAPMSLGGGLEPAGGNGNGNGSGVVATQGV